MFSPSSTLEPSTQETWDFRRRVRPASKMTPSWRTRVQDWVSIPDTQLPEPWSCNWGRWRLLDQCPPLEATLPLRYATGDAPLTPVMYANAERGIDCRDVTIFACPTKKTFYLHRSPYENGDPYTDEEMWRFDGIFPSLKAFIELADWNRVEAVEAIDPDGSELRLILSGLHLDN
ncbi:hypothetical protein C8R47DRAFT_712213 [Mycena vitilis]|nr:hypothetical protein C8R47DRAFT_712213 [Mycena vitilis]